MEIEKKYLVKMMFNIKDELEHMLDLRDKSVRFSKFTPRSIELRKNGNLLYQNNDHKVMDHRMIFDQYSRSISTAPNDSEEQALSYGNRSAFLMHVGRYEDSISDIDKAVNISTSDVLKIKLLCRKVQCLKELGNTYSFKDALKLAKTYFEKLTCDDKRKQTIQKLIEKAEEWVVKPRSKPKKNACPSKQALPKIQDSVSINYNDQYGRHLVAARDFEPGEIIMVEDLYASALTLGKCFTNCNYCMETCWSGIPCDECSFAMYCNEECKGKALKEFHDIECTVVPRIRKFVPEVIENQLVCLKALILGIKEAGGIAKLKAQLEEIDKNLEANKQCLEKEKFTSNSFASLYLLKCDENSEATYQCFSKWAAKTLVCLIDYTSLFNERMTKVEQIMKNENAMFLGTLFIKLLAIKKKNAYAYELGGECENMLSKFSCNEMQCCKIAASFAPFSSLLNHSCYPNSARCFTTDQKIILYALQPIKKNEQIFNTYAGFFFGNSKDKRHYILKNRFLIDCKCIACVEKWPAFLENPVSMPNISFGSNLEKQLFSDYRQILYALSKKNSTLDDKLIEKVSKSLSTAMKRLKQPSKVTCVLINALMNVYSHVYELKPIVLNECKHR